MFRVAMFLFYLFALVGSYRVASTILWEQAHMEDKS